MSMPFYASAEQIMRDKSEYARKMIARGRGVAVLSYSGGVLLLAENASTALHKVGEIYDRIGFAAVGRYNEFESLRLAGVRYADTRGYSYDRRDVSARGLANFFAQLLGQIFAEQMKPMEVEACVAEVGESPDKDQLYRLTYDGSVVDEPDFVVISGQAETISSALRSSYRPDMDLTEAVRMTVRALGLVGGENGKPRELNSNQLELAVLDRARPQRTFRRITGAALEALVKAGTGGDGTSGDGATGKAAAEGQQSAGPGPSSHDVMVESKPATDVSEAGEMDTSAEATPDATPVATPDAEPDAKPEATDSEPAAATPSDEAGDGDGKSDQT